MPGDAHSITRIIGIGSHHGADQLGWLLCDQLKNKSWPRDIDIQACRTPAQLPELLRDCDNAMILDAVIGGQNAGQIVPLSIQELGHQSCSHTSSHGFGISEAIELSRALKQLPHELRILGICVADTMQDAAEVSRKVLPALEQAIMDFQLTLEH